MRWKLFLFGLVSVLSWNSAAQATFVSGSTGADGAFNPTANTELQLPPNGIFNFTTVNIPSGVTVTFTKNAANTPVYILATGDVTVAGTIDIKGGTVIHGTTTPGIGGVGGYAGGYGGSTGLSGGNGMGPGGGNGGTINCVQGAGGSFGTIGGSRGGNCGASRPVYGNAKLLPLIGGSGGGGNASSGHGGGGGGGAILIASSGTITITGSIIANGGQSSGYWYDDGGGGSGGAVKLVANTIVGNGTISAIGGVQCCNVSGGFGRIRLEAYTNNRTAGTDPAYSYGLPISIFVANPPSLSITSIAGANAPSSPTGSYAQPDMLLPSTTTNPVVVNVSASNIPVGTSVTVRAIPQYGSENTAISTLSGTVASSTASASVNLSTSYSNIITAEATFTIVGMFYDGEEIDRVRVAATMGGKSETTYITKSGKEIKGEMLAALVRK